MPSSNHTSSEPFPCPDIRTRTRTDQHNNEPPPPTEYRSYKKPPPTKLQKLTDKELYALCKEYGQKTKLWRRKFAGLLPEVAQRNLYRRRNFGSIYEFAAKLGGMSKESVDTILRVAKKLENKPILMDQLISGVQGWAKLERVAYIATQDSDGFWAEKVETMPLSGLKTFVQDFRLDSTVNRNLQPEKPMADAPADAQLFEEVHFEVPSELAKKLNQLKKRADFVQTLKDFVARVEQKSEDEKPQAAITTSRHIPSKIEKFVQARTNGLCAFPGCAKKATSIHHTQRWALENVHDPARLHALCTAHERLAHLGYIQNEDEKPENWRLKTHPAQIGPKAFVDSLVGLHRQV